MESNGFVRTHYWFFAAALLLECFQCCYGSKILAIPGPPTSHVSYFREMGELLMSRGHQVDMVIPSGTNPKVKWGQVFNLFECVSLLSDEWDNCTR